MKFRAVACRFLFSTSAFGLVAGLAPAHAQDTQVAATKADPPTSTDTPSDSDGGLAEIIVTAQRREQSANKVGMSITAVTGDYLKRANITNTEDLVRAIPGFKYAQSSYGTPVYQLRGIGFYDAVIGATATISIYQDEIPLPFGLMTKGASLDIAQMEVLKGPQGTLFGQNVTGGAINYTVNRPADTFGGGVTLGYSSYGRKTGEGYVNLPLSEHVRTRLAVAFDYGGGWQKSQTRNAQLGDSRFVQGRWLVDIDATDRLKLKLSANGYKDQSDTQAGQFIGLISGLRASAALTQLTAVAATYPVPTSAREADWDPDPINGLTDLNLNLTHKGFRRDSSFWQLGARAEYELSPDVKLNSVTSLNRYHHQALVDVDGLRVNDFTVSTGGYVNSFTQEVRASGSTGPLTWVIGANYQNDKFYEPVYSFVTLPVSFSAGTQGTTTTVNTRTLAGFVHSEFRLSDTVSALGGVRYTDFRLQADSCLRDGGNGVLAALVASRYGAPNAGAGNCVTLSAAKVPGMVHEQLEESNLPWKIGINWTPAPGTLLYGLVTRGYKAGQVSPVGAFLASQLAPAKQESVLAYEAGFKVAVAHNRVQINGAAFYYDYTDKQVRGKVLINGALLSQTVNIPKARIQGAELQIAAAPTPQLHLNLGASYLDTLITRSYFTTSAVGVYEDVKGQPLPLTPKWQVQADAQYDLPIGQRLNTFFGGHLSYQSLAYGGLGEVAILRIDPYATIDLRVGIEDTDRRWSLTGFVNNVTDKYSWNNVASSSDTVVRYANSPRIFGLRGSFKY